MSWERACRFKVSIVCCCFWGGIILIPRFVAQLAVTTLRTLESLETRPPTMSVAPSAIPSVTPIRYPHVAPSVIPSVTPPLSLAMATQKVVKYRKKFKLVPIPGTGSRKLQIWLQYNVGHLLINPREAEKIAGSQAQEVYEYFMVVRHPVDRLVSLCREYQPLVLEPNQCI